MPSIDATKGIPLVNQEDNKGKEEAPLNTSLGEVSDKRSDRTAEGVQSVLNRQDVLDIAITNQVKKKMPLSLINTPVTGCEDGHDDLSDMLQGYTSPGGETIRINRDLATLLIMSAAAEMPNRAVLQAKQEAYDQVTLQAQIELGKQMAEYEEQRKRMAAEHERCLEALKQENQRMIEEAARVRQEYANAFMSSKTPSVEEIEEAQSCHHHQILKEPMVKKEKRLIDESAREKKKRLQKEQELADAEEQIEQLRKDLSFLEEALENGNKRSVPTRSRSDSPT